MGSIGKSLKKVVKKVMRPKVLIPLALMAATGGLSGIGGAMGGAKAGLLGKAAVAGTTLPGTAGGFSAATSGLLGTGGKLALGKGTLAKGIMSGLANPLSKKGLATYGGLAALGMGMLGDKPEKAEDPIDRKALNQANYNMMRMYGQNAGYTNEDINTIYGPLGEMMGGGHTEVPADPSQRRRIQFPGTNYPIYTTQGAANGGRIGYADGPGPAGVQPLTEEEWQALDPNAEAPAPGSYLGDPEFSKRTQAANEAAMAEMMRLISGAEMGEGVDLERLLKGKANGGRIGLSGGGMPEPSYKDVEERYAEGLTEREFIEFEMMSPEQRMEAMRNAGLLRANGGRIGLAGGGGAYESWKDFVEPLMIKFPELEDMSNEEQVEFLRSKGMIRDDAYATGGRIHRNIGGIMNAGSIPQTMQNPADMNMQLDGRGGGFIPMGEKPQADDVPAMLSKDEFVMTRDAVKNMGDGDTNVGAQRMYDLMNNLEAKVV